MHIGAIDGGGTKVLTAVLTETGEVLARRHASVPTADHTAYFTACAEMLRACAAEAGLTFERLAGVGVSLPAMTDGRDRVLGSPSAGWGAFSVRPLLVPALGMDTGQIFIENDVNACALAEMRFAHGGENFVWMTVSTGIGGAVVADGRLVRGAGYCAGELGHVKVEFETPRQCGCGGRGCLEAHASGTAIGRLAREAGLDADAKQCGALASQGDPVARAVLVQAGRYIGRALAMTANVLNPGRVYIGGGVAHALALLLPSIREAFDRDVLPQCRKVVIGQTRLGYEASLFGAAAVCLDGLGARMRRKGMGRHR
jgi:glucokinase